MPGFDLDKDIDRSQASLPTVRRLPSYLHTVRQMANDGIEVISGTVIARELGLEPIQVRKDLSVTGIIGKPRVGYMVKELITALENFLRWNQTHNAILVGPGNLGSALLGYREFRNNGLQFVAAFDTSPQKVGQEVNGVKIKDWNDLKQVVQDNKIDIAVITVPNDAAQGVAETLIEHGIKAIWNFTNVKLKVPPGINVRKEDLSSGYAVLSVTAKFE